MNVMGKILVILNFLFAIAVGGFLVVDFATRTNWKDAYNNAKKEMAAADAHWRTMSDTVGKYEANLKTVQQERDAARKAATDANDEREAVKKSLELKLIDAELQARGAEETSKTAIGEKVRLIEENKKLIEVLAQRDLIITGLQAEVVKTKNHAVAMENQVKIVQDRNEQLLSRNVQVEKELIKKSAPGGADPDKVLVRGQANPPAVYVEGKIEAVHKDDNGLVQLSVGSDKGLVKNQTLEVFRVNPPTYLGLIRVTDVQPHHAFGRLERVGGGAVRPTVRVGDTVATSITRN